MISVENLKAQREVSLAATSNGIPSRTINPFFGVGPITDMTTDEFDARQLRHEFDAWVEENYPKLDDKGNKVGKFTTAELGRGMHRGYPADKVLVDMMREINRYFGFPKSNKMAVGLGGGHSGFTVCAQHLVNANKNQQIFVDTPETESEAGQAGGFFRQSWGAQLLEMQRYAKNGDESRINFSKDEGHIPTADELTAMGITLFFGVGHETTGATTYREEDVLNLLEWIDRDPENHHAVIDGTSMLGAMPWAQSTVSNVLLKCCMFTPFQKAIGGISGYFIISLTPQALVAIDENMKEPSWAIPRQLKIAVPVDAKRPLSSEITTSLGPIYDPEKEEMLGGIINTYSTLAFAETTFGLLRVERMLGGIQAVNDRSASNRQAISDWVENNNLFDLGVADSTSRGAAVTLLKVNDADITDDAVDALIIAKSKQILGYEGLTHPNGDYESGLDVARYVNAFPGTPGSYRAWIGGVRPETDIIALLENLNYAYHRAKIVVLEEQLASEGVHFEKSEVAPAEGQRKDDSNRAYKVLVADLIGLKFTGLGEPDHSEVQAHIEDQGGVFHGSALTEGQELETGKIHFFYEPNLSTEEELLAHTSQGQYDSTIVAATFLPETSKFNLGGVRIGAGTGNMGSASWGGGNGDGGDAPLMNTPSFNSRATAQMAMKALLDVLPNLPVQELHNRVVDENFDTGKNLREYPTEKLEGKTLAVIGYGNIGRELAKLAQAFGMHVNIYARPIHKAWIESEGFSYAASPEKAAKGSDVISPHTGLGALDASTGIFTNANLVDAKVLNGMNDNSVVINYDRGEVIDASALDVALSSGKVAYACIDADLFKNDAGELSGPMVPYLPVEKNHRGKVTLLPHAAADTEHVSRVEGAKQAVDQIIDVIKYQRVTNLKGDLPDGYQSSGAKTVNGVGKVTGQDIAKAAADSETIAQLRATAEKMAAFWGAVEATDNPELREALIKNHGSELVQSSNNYETLMAANGIKGPYSG
jgi:lactate dehydrogenase-like 2-hydroxyacid dehydrogenase/phosphoserine aminotransferase